MVKDYTKPQHLSQVECTNVCQIFGNAKARVITKKRKAVLWHQEMEVNTQTVYKIYHIQR